MFDAMKVKNECVDWIRGFFETNGAGCNAVVGISGGKDSSTVAALCVEALGRELVIGVLMPNFSAHSLNVAQNSAALALLVCGTALLNCCTVSLIFCLLSSSRQP